MQANCGAQPFYAAGVPTERVPEDKQRDIDLPMADLVVEAFKLTELARSRTFPNRLRGNVQMAALPATRPTRPRVRADGRGWHR